jgi:hypothetical protein
MAEENKPKTDYAANSAKSKQTGPAPSERPELKQIASATVRKKGVGAKFKETFIGDTAESVGQYILFDVIVPRIKDLLFDIINGGSERALYGTTTARSASRGRRSQLVEKTNYRGLSEQAKERPERDISARGRATHNFEEILIPSRGEAEQVLDTLLSLVDQYDSATVADLYSTVGISTDHTDLKFGWTDLSEARIVPARGGGYILEMPRAEAL